VQLDSKSRLARDFGRTSVAVVSSHHQCVDQPGNNLSVTAKSEDGLVEAIEGKDDRFLVGVQWHPERDFEVDRKLFEDFVQAAAKHQRERLQTTTAQVL
jgi:putative glutamine amidotransferase